MVRTGMLSAQERRLTASDPIEAARFSGFVDDFVVVAEIRDSTATVMTALQNRRTSQRAIRLRLGLRIAPRLVQPR
jgi:hypothetical protein